jgi:hypothetical protein
VKRSAALVALVPAAVVSVTSTRPEPAGAVAVIELALTTVKFVAAVVPNFTAVALLKPEPVIVTAVPPPVGPKAGEIAVTVGATI